MRISEITQRDLSIEVVDRLLFHGLEDTGENADCIHYRSWQREGGKIQDTCSMRSIIKGSEKFF